MLKRFLAAVLSFLLIASAASADIIPPAGVDEAYQSFSGISALRAYVLCDSLTVRADRSQSAKAVHTLRYGDSFLTWESWDGWCNCYYSDGREVGWVRSDYVIVNPAMYATTGETAVYAYPDTMAPRVALLDPGEKLPILHEMQADSHDWCVVSLRGASGWIKKQPEDTAADFWFTPDKLQSISAATLSIQYQGKTVDAALTDAAKLRELASLLSVAEDHGAAVAGCPFGLITLALLTPHGPVTLDIAADSCNIYRVDGARDYEYSEPADEDAQDPSKEDIFRLFGIESPLPY